MSGDFCRLATNKTIPEEAKHAELLPPENELAKRPHDQRETAESPLPFLRNREIDARNDPRRSALEKKELSRTRSDLRNKLDGACSGAHHGDVLAFQIHIVVPIRGMKLWTGKTVDAL